MLEERSHKSNAGLKAVTRVMMSDDDDFDAIWHRPEIGLLHAGMRLRHQASRLGGGGGPCRGEAARRPAGPRSRDKRNGEAAWHVIEMAGGAFDDWQ